MFDFENMKFSIVTRDHIHDIESKCLSQVTWNGKLKTKAILRNNMKRMESMIIPADR